MKSFSEFRTNKNEAGFTIIEVMIAMAIFIVIVTVGMGATLDAISQHYRTQNMRTVMDSLNFMLEDMARNIRLGSHFHCQLGSEVSTSTDGHVAPQDCPMIPGVSGGSNMIVFEDLRGNHVIYSVTPPSPLSGTLAPQQVYKQKDASSSPVQITPPTVVMDYYKSGFTVRGSLPGSAGDQSQPSITIRLAGYVQYQNTKTNFAVQTTVMARSLDY